MVRPALIAAEAIRKHAPADEIVLIGDEPEPPYSKWRFLTCSHGEIDEAEPTCAKGDDHFQRLRISLRVDRARAVDTAARKVALDGGSELGFDRLLIATGSYPARLPVPGADLAGVNPCWTLADARRSWSGPAVARVFADRSGFIGCIILEALANRGVSLTVWKWAIGCAAHDGSGAAG